MEYFVSEKLSRTMTGITDIAGVHCFLVEGSERAVLIDTGAGAGNLKKYIAGLTELPVDVILTHGHCDHAGGAAGFDRVYLAEADWKLAEYHATMERKIEYVRFAAEEQAEHVAEEDFAPVRKKAYLPLKDRQIFDLGGVTLKVIAVPGHTAGMVCVLNVEERSILFGDACNPCVFLWDEESEDVSVYKESLENLKKVEKDYDTVYLSHGPYRTEKKILDNVIEVCDTILAGKADNQPFDFMGYEGILLAKAADANGMRKDGIMGNIVYRRK